MSAYKKLNRQDVFISDYVARKQWEFKGLVSSSQAVYDPYSIQILRGVFNSSNTYEDLVYRSINHLYYTSSFGDGTYTGSFDLSLQTTLTISSSRQIKNSVTVISIPKELYGTHIEPGSFTLEPWITGSIENYITDDLGGNEYVDDVLYTQGGLDLLNYVTGENLFTTASYIDERPSTEGEYVDNEYTTERPEIYDSGNGVLLKSGSNRYVGDIVYNHGMIIITDPDIAEYYNAYDSCKIRWKSNQPIYTYNVNCKVRDSEMNYTYNRTALTGSNGRIKNELTGSYFNPYITTVGLYNDAHELIAVAKTGRPIEKLQHSDMTIVLKLDIW